MEHASTVDIGARKRRSGGINEDSVATAVLENHHRQTSRPVGVFVLGDGVGGEASGDVASFLATTVVRKRLTEALLGSGTDVIERFGVDAYRDDPPTMDDDPSTVLSTEWIREVIQEAIDDAHGHVQQFARDVGARPATTIVVGVYADGILHYGWVGDSRIYLLNAEHGEIQQLTRDHAVTNRLLDEGEIEDEVYARVHGDATAITNAIGGSAHGKPSVSVDFGTVEVYREDVVMLTSDGLIDAFPDIGPLREQYQRAEDTASIREEILETLVTDDEILDIVLEANDLHEAVAALIEFANDRGGKDNLSITLVRDSDAEPSPDSLPTRGVVADSETLTDQNTMVEPAKKNADDGEAGGSSGGSDGDESTAEAAASAESGGDVADAPEAEADAADDSTDDGSTDDESDDASSDDTGGSAEIVSAGDVDAPTAAITIGDHDRIFEVADGATIGRDTGESDGGPTIGLGVGDTTIERKHVRLEYDGGDEAWLVRDCSSSGTYVEVNEGEWLLLLSSEGADFHKELGFDPGAVMEQGLDETHPLEDGMTFTFDDPRNEDPITFQFFTSTERAQEYRSEADGSGHRFSRFLP